MGATMSRLIHSLNKQSFGFLSRNQVCIGATWLTNTLVSQFIRFTWGITLAVQGLRLQHFYCGVMGSSPWLENYAECPIEQLPKKKEPHNVHRGTESSQLQMKPSAASAFPLSYKITGNLWFFVEASGQPSHSSTKTIEIILQLCILNVMLL